MELWELVARERVRDTIAKYSMAADGGRIDEMLSLFSDDATMETPPLKATGRQNIRDLFQIRRGRRMPEAAEGQKAVVRHLTTNLNFQSIAPDRIETIAYFCVLTPKGPDHWGRYFDVLVPDGDRWVFSHRVAKAETWIQDSWYTSWEQ